MRPPPAYTGVSQWAKRSSRPWVTSESRCWIARVTFPFFLLMIAAVGLIYLFPGIVTALPRQMMG